MFNNDVESLTPREHILTRPSMYIGGIDLTETNEYILSDGKLQERELTFVPGLIKIINEVIDNSVDIAIKTKFEICNQISVKIDDTSVEVIDNGPGIPLKEVDGIMMPRVAWGSAMAGSNFKDDANRTTTGMNGIGSYATNVWSKSFIGISDDGKKRYEVQFEDNGNFKTESSSKSKKRGVTVKFYPDLERFGLEKIDDSHKDMIKQRLINLNLCYPNIQFKYNGKALGINSFKKYIQLFNLPFEMVEDEKYSIAVLPNEQDEFKQFSYVNGLYIKNGGTHTNYISNEVTNRIRDKLGRKFKNIKPADIRNKLFVVAFLRDFPNLKFNSQTKEFITNSTGEVSSFLQIDFDTFGKKILKNDSIIDPITEIYKLKEEYKKRQEMKNLEKPKKIKSERYIPPSGKPQYLILGEGLSAIGSLSHCLGSNGIGYFCLKGKPFNAYSGTQQKFLKNEELSELYQILKRTSEVTYLGDGPEWFKITIDNQEMCVNINDEVFINDKWISVKELIKNENVQWSTRTSSDVAAPINAESPDDAGGEEITDTDDSEGDEW